MYFYFVMEFPASKHFWSFHYLIILHMISNESAYQQQDEPEMAMESMVQKRYMGQQTFSYM